MTDREELKENVPEITAPKETPKGKRGKKPLPEGEQKLKTLPEAGTAENCIRLAGTLIEIKPTKLRYQRNRTALFYKFLDIYPLVDILGMDTGAFGDDRDGDKALFDWLVAVTDDEELVKQHYDEFDSDMIEKLLLIFKRLNRIDEKEQKQKNLEENLKRRG